MPKVHYTGFPDKVTFLLLTQKFSNIPQLLGFCPRPHFRKIHIAKSYTLNFIIFIVFNHCFYNRKVVLFLLPPNQKIVLAPMD